MDHITKKLIAWVQKETVLTVAMCLAVLSMVIVPPSKEYIGYIDFRSLAILFCLMAVMAGFQKLGFFRFVAVALLKRVSRVTSVVFILVLLCFFFSMVITNDVALITFVPFTFTVLSLLGEEEQKRLLIPVVVLQTAAANLGSMLTPLGNPQNLYLYGRAGISFGEFIQLMLPYSTVSLVLLMVCCFGLRTIGTPSRGSLDKGALTGASANLAGQQTGMVVYTSLFLLSLFTVLRLIPYGATLVATTAVVLFYDRDVLKRVDYSLLATFVGFFIFIGNMGNVQGFAHFLQEIILGREVYVAVFASQFISNVPAALLLSGFTGNIRGLIIGTNLGGLGTLIASMASLISYKQIARNVPEKKGTYFAVFTVVNVIYLAILLVFHIWWGRW